MVPELQYSRIWGGLDSTYPPVSLLKYRYKYMNMAKVKSVGELFDLTGRVAIVTGAADGIGRGCAEILAASGASVVVSDRSLEKAQTVADTINTGGGTAIALECNVMRESDLQALVDNTVKAFGTVNILVNNVGIGGGGRENPYNIDRAYVERVFAVNVFAPWELIKLSAPYMSESGYGSVVNITSIGSVCKDPGMAIYAGSKAALNHMSANLCYDYGLMGIRINNVGPGATRTSALASVLTPEIEAVMLQHTPLKRLGEVSDIARAVLFFASPISSWVNGQVLFVNGGGSQTLG